jgi:transcriptional regulator of met regulon
VQEILSKLEICLEEFKSIPASVLDAESMSEGESRAYNDLRRRGRSEHAAAAAMHRVVEMPLPRPAELKCNFEPATIINSAVR